MTLLDEMEPQEEKKKSGILGQIIILVVLTLVAAGSGWAIGTFVLKPADPQMAAMSNDMKDEKKEKKSKASDKDGEAEGDDEEAPMSGHLVPLTPITANIATPEDTWIRLELAVLFSEDPGDELPEMIHQDILAFVQTLKLYQLEGASGLRHLRQDMNDLARFRSDGSAKSVLIRALLLE